MKKVHLSRYLKPYFSLAVIGIILLFAQANTELALPDYLSKIVNVGIQQEGIENSVPEAIRESQMKKVFLFMSAENKTKVLSAYSLENSSTADDKMLNRYPLLSNDSIFILKDQSKDTINLLNLAMAKALLIVFNIDNYIANASSPQLSMNMSIFANISSDMIYPLLESLPEQNRTLMLVQIENYLGKFPESYLIQGAVAPIKAEYVIIGMDVAQIQLFYILKVGGLMLVLTILSVLCAFGVGWTSAKTASGFARDVRKDLFARVECFSNAEFDKFSTASLITRSTNDITQIQMLVILIFRMVFFAPTMALGATVRAINKALSMAWLIALAVIILICMIILLFSIVYPKFKMFQKLIDRVSLVAREGLTGMLVIRAFNREQFEMERFDDANKELTATALFTNRTMVFLFPVMTMIMNGLSLAIVWIGANEIANATLQVGDMIAFTQYAMHVVFSFLIISMVFIFFPRASVSGDRIAEVLSTELLIKDPVGPVKFSDPFDATIKFENVSFKYPGAEVEVIKDLSFTAKAGQMTALIGPTGSGKSTIINLIPRFYEVTEGRITIDGKDIRSVTQHDLRDKIGFVPQKSSLFSGTIASNLYYGDPDASEETIVKALEIAQATEIVKEKEDGLESSITQGGSNVSGGQKQRFSIARALVKKAPIYLLDDATSSLDFKTDAAVRKALRQHTKDSTIILVSQRVSSIMQAEQIIVLDEGKMVGIGKHDELLRMCQTYREIAKSQLELEE